MEGIIIIIIIVVIIYLFMDGDEGMLVEEQTEVTFKKIVNYHSN